MDKAQGLLTLDEAARYLGVSKTSLRRWTNEGRLACHRVGVRRERRFDIKMLNEFLANGDLIVPTAKPESGNVARDLAQMVQGGAQRHVCLFYRDQDEQWANFRPYFLDHFNAGAPTVYLYDSSTPQWITSRLEKEGIDADDALQKGLLRLHSSRETYLKSGRFSADLMIETMQGFAKGLIEAGSERQLLVGEMSWFFSGSPGVEEIHDYETRLNVLLDAMPSVTIVCHYDMTRFDAENALHACCSHPVVQLGERLQTGFYG